LKHKDILLIDSDFVIMLPHILAILGRNLIEIKSTFSNYNPQITVDKKIMPPHIMDINIRIGCTLYTVKSYRSHSVHYFHHNN